MTSRSAKLVAFGAALALSLMAFFLALKHQERLHFPRVKVAAPQGLEIEFLLSSQNDKDQCLSLVANMASATQSTCRQCSILEQACLDSLTPNQKEYFATTPLSIPTAHMRNGVIAFSAADPVIALVACRESERQARSNSVSCYPPGSIRPPLEIARHAHSFYTLLASPVFWGTISSVFLFAITRLLLFSHAAHLSASLLRWPRRQKQLLVLLADTLAIEFALWAAFALRLDSAHIFLDRYLTVFMLAPLVAFMVFGSFGLYRSVIRYLGLHALLAITKATTVYCALLVIFIHLLSLPPIDYSIFIIHGILALLLVGASRTVARYWLRLSESTSQVHARRRVIIYGAGSAGIQLATALAHSREFHPVAFVDDDEGLHRHRLGALQVFPPDHVARLIARFAVEEVLLAIPSSSRARRNEIIATLEPLPVHVRTLPGLAELAEGKIKMEDLREVGIEDLLGRDPVAPNPVLLQANVTGRSVMVTGAGGSIGSELCRQILNLDPTVLVLYELTEFALYSVEQDLINRCRALGQVNIKLLPILGSVTDQGRLERVIRQFKVQTIYHAAAYKHVPMVEKNPCEGVSNNIFGTYHAALAALAEGVETFVLISTDKAVRPTNTMGTTKRFAELVLQALAERNPDKTRFTMVRFGNVLGSSGSVVPLFREQIRRGGPITVTDPRIIRYFMTIPEAAQLVIQAGAMGQDGDVFVLDMGEPVKIVDLAKRMIHLSGLSVRDPENPRGDIEIVFSGLRPGEKLYEELLIGTNVVNTAHPRIMRAIEEKLPLEVVELLISDLKDACNRGDSNATRQLLLKSVKEFSPQCKNEDLLETA